jgi:calcineurin-like phosphoesterase family protein
MSILFSADMHLGHANIAKYTNRPYIRDGDLDYDGNWTSQKAKFACAERMNESLIANWNSRVHPLDTVYHLGDFCCHGRARGEEGSRSTAEYWESRLNGKIVHIRGNHDKNNSVKASLEYAIMEFAGLSWLLKHVPPRSKEEIPTECDVVLCGHVHNLWSCQSLWGKPAINVGTDVRKYAPMTKSEVYGVLQVEFSDILNGQGDEEII